MRFAGRTVLITGASQGVGLATVRRFHDEGAHVVLLARREGPLKKATRGLDPARCLTISADVADFDALQDAIAQTVSRFGGLDGLVNNAGAHFRGPVLSRSAAEIGTMVDVNLRAPLQLTRLALPELQTRNGFVVNVASLAGKIPLDGAATYSSTKFGLRAFSFALAEELSEDPATAGIKVSVVSPGPIETGFILDEIDDVADITFSQTMCTADDVAEMIVDCAVDGRREREFPVGGAKLATLGYLVPALRRVLKPRLAARGRRVKAELKRRATERD